MWLNCAYAPPYARTFLLIVDHRRILSVQHHAHNKSRFSYTWNGNLSSQIWWVRVESSWRLVRQVGLQVWTQPAQLGSKSSIHTLITEVRDLNEFAELHKNYHPALPKLNIVQSRDFMGPTEVWTGWGILDLSRLFSQSGRIGFFYNFFVFFYIFLDKFMLN